jgi:hypothetical protein
MSKGVTKQGGSGQHGSVGDRFRALFSRSKKAEGEKPAKPLTPKQFTEMAKALLDKMEKLDGTKKNLVNVGLLKAGKKDEVPESFKEPKSAAIRRRFMDAVLRLVYRGSHEKHATDRREHRINNVQDQINQLGEKLVKKLPAEVDRTTLPENVQNKIDQFEQVPT